MINVGFFRQIYWGIHILRNFNVNPNKKALKECDLSIRVSSPARAYLLFFISFYLIFSCFLSPRLENMYAQEVNQFKNMTPDRVARILQTMTPAQREQALQKLTPEQQNIITQIIKSQQAVKIDTVDRLIKEGPKRFEGFTIEPMRIADDQKKDLEVIGMSYFKPARDRILAIENSIRQGKVPPVETRDAISGYIGPLDMISTHVQIGTPERYFLSPGDVVEVSYWGNNLQLTTINVRVNRYGVIENPLIGKIIARGMTLQQFEKAAHEQYMRMNNPTDFHLIATLDRLKSIQVFISGEAFRPGSYAVSVMTTLFNVLYACGGPGDNGSLRSIRLLRGRQTHTVDFYDYLLKGSTKSDYPLQGGDIIHIGQTGRRILTGGEVYRKGIYELKADESLNDLIALTGGIKPTGLRKNVFVETILPNWKRVTRDVNIDDKKAVAGLKLMDGDIITVRHIYPLIKNYVSAEGHVKNPGSYELKSGMRLSELVGAAEPLEDSHLEKAIVVRFNFEDESYNRIAIDLDRLLAGDDAENLFLLEWDRLIVFSKDEVVYTPKKEVRILGAVQRPGPYVRSDSMRIGDLVFEAGGLLPGYYHLANLARARSEKETEIITINLDELMSGKKSENLILRDQDIFNVKKRSDFIDEPIWITISGEVNYPGPYVLKDNNVRLTDVIKMAGGFTDEAYAKGLVFKRKKEFVVQGEQEDLLIAANRSVTDEMKIQFYQEELKNRLALSTVTKQPVGDESAAPKMPAITGSVVSGGDIEKTMAAGIVPVIAEGTGETMEKMIEGLGGAPSFGAVLRELRGEDIDFSASERILVDIQNIMAGNEEDIIMKPEDDIYVPTIPMTISVRGAVNNSLTLNYIEGKKIKYYIERAGGYDNDADKKRVRVVRMDGAVWLADDIKAIEQGDIIYVPTRVMSVEIKSTTDKVLDVIKYAMTTAASIAVFMVLIGKISEK